ncbi:MAG TPA: amino acid adenylation domain-containing protein, partial [Flavisolibacter sp.]
QHLQLVPAGVYGELYVGGAGIARGYLNRQELTRQRFIPDPFAKGERLYRSGDRVRLLPNGEMEYDGRIDEQVKIRGYRIELGEIENALLQYPDISEALVMAHENTEGDKSLAAYVVGKTGLTITALRAWLSGRLPDYMVPSYYIELEQFPLTSNGKINRKALAALKGQGMSTGVEYIAPRNEMEEKMALIWQEVLGKERIGVREGFFELGGDSIKVLRMISSLQKTLDLKVPVADVYKNNTIEKLALHIARTQGEINTRARESGKAEMEVRAGIEELKQRILSSNLVADKENIEDIYPMSPIETGMVFGTLMSQAPGVYHDQFVYKKTFHDFNIERFTRALELLVDKHSILRTAFNIKDYGAEVQVVYKKIGVSVHHMDLADLDAAAQQTAVLDYLRSELEHPFDVSRAPLWRMTVFNFGNEEHGFAWQFHHAIMDGWSNASFITELNNVYLKLKEAPSYHPGKLRSDYKDFIIQHEVDRRDEQVREFWKQELSEHTRLDLFMEEDELKEYSYTIDHDRVQKLKSAAAGMNITVKALSFSAFLQVLKVMNYGSEIVVGLVTNTRPVAEDADKILGCFLNTIPFKTIIGKDVPCADFVAGIQQKLVELKRFENLSMADIAMMLHQTSNAGNPFFDVLFNYIDFHVYNAVQQEVPESAGVKGAAAAGLFSQERTNTYFDFNINAKDDFYTLRLRLTKKIKSGLTPERIAELYFTILDFMTSSPSRPVHEAGFLTEKEKQLLVEFNRVEPYFPLEKNILQVIEEQALAQPRKTAIQFNGQAIDYASLNATGNQLGRFLKENYSATTDTLFGVMMARSITMAETILGIWKAGGAYVPIDRDYPEDRIRQMIEASGLAALIIDGSVDAEHISSMDLSVPVIHLDLARSILKELPSHNLPAIIGDEDLAYVIYTSGSTGKPKGVMIEHWGMMNHIGAKIIEMKIGADSRIVQNAAHTFDISVWQFFSALVAGGTTVIYDNDTILNLVRFTDRIERDGITVLELVPSYFAEMLEVLERTSTAQPFSSLQVLILNAETLMPSLVRRWFALYPGIPIVNTYGATEASDDISHYIMHTCPDTQTVPVLKRPIQHFKVHIVDEGLRPVPVGVKGEILLSGPAVGRGYLNDPGRTAQAFLAGPLNGLTTDKRIYRTGDLGRYLPDGTMEFLGRKDTQVKVRGHRIELGEIELALNRLDAIREGVIIDRRNEKGEVYLAAFYTSETEVETSDIKAFLREKLPAYMVPSYFVKLDRLPLTPNGKVDRKALKTWEITVRNDQDHTAPQTALEEKLVNLWKEIFDAETISTSDNFFDLGGDSFKA